MPVRKAPKGQRRLPVPAGCCARAAASYASSSQRWVHGCLKPSYTALLFARSNPLPLPAPATHEMRSLTLPTCRIAGLQVVVPGMQQLYDLYSFNVIPQIGR